MSLRLRCESCGTAFLTTDDHLGGTVACPKCGAEQAVPTTAPLAPADEDHDEPSHPGRLRRLAPIFAVGLLVGLALALTATLVAWPQIRARWNTPVAARPAVVPSGPSEPSEPVLGPAEAAARDYLRAMADGDAEALQRLGTVEEPPAIRSFGTPQLVPERSEEVRGNFAPIGKLHAKIAEDFDYDPKIGRFTPKNALGPAAETLDALHAVKEKAERDDLYAKMQSGDPEDIFDAAEGLASAYAPLAALADTVLKPAKLIPSYLQLVKEARPSLPPQEEALALDYGANPKTWDALLKRPFLTLKADGPFILERVEVAAPVRDALASAGDPPSDLRLTLTRFRLEGIDTGWKVTSARRHRTEDDEPTTTDTPPPSPGEDAGTFRSPGESP